MTAYTATFADGFKDSLKNSKREYTHAWRVTADDGYSMGGWAGSEELARKAVASTISFITVKPTRGGWGQYYKTRTFTPRTGVKSEVVTVVRG